MQAPCPGCNGAITSFEPRHATAEFGSVIKDGAFIDGDQTFTRKLYVLMRCASCGRGGLATVGAGESVAAGKLLDFYPLARETATLPKGVPPGVEGDYREAELCASVAAWRGASALLRSALEKTLQANGYTKGNLEDRIDKAAEDGVITAARQRRAHEDVRSLGNDILHDEWRPVTEGEYAAAHHYVQRIIEDFYDQRGEVEAILKEKGQLPEPGESTARAGRAAPRRAGG